MTFKIIYTIPFIYCDDCENYTLTVSDDTSIKEIRQMIGKKELIKPQQIIIYHYIQSDHEGLLKKKLKDGDTIGQLELYQNSVLNVEFKNT